MPAYVPRWRVSTERFADFDEFLRALSATCQIAFARGWTVWFRGQEDADWPLTSKLHREVNDLLKRATLPVPFGGPAFNAIAREFESRTYREFERRSWPTLLPEQRKPWALLFAMRHSGLPTRLLDWSESLAVALVFARAKRDDTPLAIFTLDPEQLNRATTGHFEVQDPEGNEGLLPHHPLGADPQVESPWPRTVAVQAPHSSDRMSRQRGTFIVTGSESSALEDAYPCIIRKFVLESAGLAKLDLFLNLMGLGEHALFGDLSHLASEVSVTVEQRLCGELLEFAGRIRGGERPPAGRPIEWGFVIANSALAELGQVHPE